MAELFAPLFQPLRLGRKTAPSRIVFAAHQTNFARHNRFDSRHAAYYAARARGGAGVIVLEGSVVHPSDWPYEYAIFGYDERIVPTYQMIAEALRPHGPVVLAQLTHSGMQGTSHYSQAALWAPSPIPEVNSREVPKEMEPEDIAAVIDGFATAARYAIEGGLDGVEINAGPESLVRQFLSPLTNQRQDEYGGPLENRLRFARKVIAAVRRAVGDEAVVGLRLSGDEHAPWAGIKPGDAAEIARILSSEHQIDYLSVTSGSIYTPHLIRAGLYMPPGYALHLAAEIKEAVQIPVFAQGSIVDPRQAAMVLVEGRADAVKMTRALIADPDLPRKVRDGRAEDVRQCILCNQDCVVQSVQNPRLSCSINPAAGHEAHAEFATLPPAVRPKRVMVIGGGPAGMEAARVAALRGHRVTLYEQNETLGGALLLASAEPGRKRLELIGQWLEAQIRKLGVTIHLGVTATFETVRAELPDAVIVAVGGVPVLYPGVDFDNSVPVLNERDVLGGAPLPPTGKAVVLDEIGDHDGMAVAEWLVHKGWKVEIVTRDMFCGQRLTATQELTAWNQRAWSKGVIFHPQREAVRVTNRTLIMVDRFSREEERIEQVDLIVDVTYDRPDETLYFTLKEAGFGAEGMPALYRAGDCVAPRRISQAVLEGYRAGRAV